MDPVRRLTVKIGCDWIGWGDWRRRVANPRGGKGPRSMHRSSPSLTNHVTKVLDDSLDHLVTQGCHHCRSLTLGTTTLTTSLGSPILFALFIDDLARLVFSCPIYVIGLYRSYYMLFVSYFCSFFFSIFVHVSFTLYWIVVMLESDTAASCTCTGVRRWLIWLLIFYDAKVRWPGKDFKIRAGFGLRGLARICFERRNRDKDDPIHIRIGLFDAIYSNKLLWTWVI
jgi:hypothetical protein